MWVQSLGQEDPLEEDTATHSSFLAWRIPWTEKPDDYSPEGRKESEMTKVTCCCCEVASVMSDSVRPQKRQPTRLPHPWESPGKNTGVGCCQEPAREIPPMTRSCAGGLTSKADQDSRDPLDLLEHLPQNQNLSVLLFCTFHQLF